MNEVILEYRVGFFISSSACALLQEICEEELINKFKEESKLLKEDQILIKFTKKETNDQAFDQIFEESDTDSEFTEKCEKEIFCSEYNHEEKKLEHLKPKREEEISQNSLTENTKKNKFEKRFKNKNFFFFNFFFKKIKI